MTEGMTGRISWFLRENPNIRKEAEWNDVTIWHQYCPIPHHAKETKDLIHVDCRLCGKLGEFIVSSTENTLEGQILRAKRLMHGHQHWAIAGGERDE